ncbi:unnamed protein product [Prorocentrum cordatum]|uniref:ABC transmembrane type-1 domain-containing protein n=1 Tax=Prorocentrum cordatum TaxID=2364126 RepID=A0ABN9TG52_9DINO|nr:unnamed protein product [Polarella glacialis]
MAAPPRTEGSFAMSAEAQAGGQLLAGLAVLCRQLLVAPHHENGTGRLQTWFWTAVMITAAVKRADLFVLFTKVQAGSQTAIQQGRYSDFWAGRRHMLAVVLGTALAAVAQESAAGRLKVLWRKAASAAMLNTYLDEDNSFYRMKLAGTVENPDHRITDDIRTLVDYVVDLASKLPEHLTKFVGLSGLMWRTSPLTCLMLWSYALLGTHASRQPQGGSPGAGQGPGASGGKLTPERKDALLAMSAEHFEACSIWLSPGQKAHLLGLRAEQTGDPLALSRQAKQQHDTLKDQVAKAKNAWEKSQELLAKQLQKTAELKAKFMELEAKELEAARAAASAFSELGRASRPQPADHAAYLVEQLRELGVEAGVVDSIKQVAEARDHDLDMDAAIGNLKQGDWMDKLVSSAGESGITRSQLEVLKTLTRPISVAQTKQVRCRIRHLQSSPDVPDSNLAVCFLEALDRFRVFDYVVMDYFAAVASDTAECLHKQATQLKIVNWDRWVKTHSVGGAAALFKYVQLPDPWQPSTLDSFTLRPNSSMGVPPRSFLHLPDVALELLCGLIGKIVEQGAASKELDVLRSQAAAALDAKTSGKSRTLALALAPQANYDPIWRATLEPIKAFSSVLWAARVPCHVLEHGLEAARLALSGKDQMWPQVRGPLGALFATLARVGIVVVEPLVWKLPDGLELKLKYICPRVLLHCCAHAVRHWVNLQISEHLQMPEFRTGFWDGPLKHLLSAKGNLTWQQRGYLRSAIIGLLPYPLQDIDGAELYALFAVLRFAVPPVVVHTDSDFVWKGTILNGPLKKMCS